MKFQDERTGIADDESDFIAAAAALKQLVLASDGQLPASTTLRQSFTTLQGGASDTRQGAVELTFSLVQQMPRADTQGLNSSNGGKGKADASKPAGTTNPTLGGVGWDAPITAESEVADEDEDEDEDELVAAAAVLRKLTVGSREEDPLGVVSPFSWEELEVSCQQLDSSEIRITTMDLTCLLAEGGEEATAAGTVLYNFELDAASAQVPAQRDLRKHFSYGSMPVSGSPKNSGIVESTSSASLPATRMSPPAPLVPAMSPSLRAMSPPLPAKSPSLCATSPPLPAMSPSLRATSPPLPAKSPSLRATSPSLAPTSETMPEVPLVTLAPLNTSPSSNLPPGGTEDYWAHIGITAMIPESMGGASSYAKSSSSVDKDVLEEGEKISGRTAGKPKKQGSKWVVRVTAKWLGLVPKGVGENI